MLKVNLAELHRVGPFTLEVEVPGDSELWEGSGLDFVAPLSIRLEVAMTGTGQVRVWGGWHGVIRQPCRRCLSEVDSKLEEGTELLFAPSDELAGDGDDEGIREIPPRTLELDLAPAVREEVILAAPIYSVCRADCRGLCPHCGTDWNEATCDCTLEEPDPRWDALRALKKE